MMNETGSENRPVSPGGSPDGLGMPEAPKLGRPKNAKKTRGRPRADKVQHEIENSRVEVQSDRMEKAHSPNRPPRVPMGSRLKLELPHGSMDTKLHHPRWFSDRDGRIAEAKGAWYEHVKDPSGDNIKRHRGPYTQFLMKIDKKLWLEDQKLKEEAVRVSMEGIQKIGPREYLPDGRHSVSQKEEYDPMGL